MTDYYIKITTEEPNDDSTWFKLYNSEDDNISDDELLILKKNDYIALKDRVDSAVANVTNYVTNFISEDENVIGAIEDIIEGGNFQLENARNSVNTRNIVDEYDNKYTYTSLKNALDSKADHDDVLSTMSSLNNQINQNTSSIRTLETTVDKYAWKQGIVTFGFMGMVYDDNDEMGIDVWYNDILVFLSLRISINLTGTGGYVQFGTLHLYDIGNIDLKPPLMVIQELPNGAMMKITSDGKFWIKYTKGKTDTVSTLVTVMYPRRGSYGH